MKECHRVLLKLIQCSIEEKKYEIPEKVDWITILTLAKEHKVEMLLYYGIYISGAEVPKEVFQDLTMCVLKMTSIDSRQEHEISNLLTALEEAKVDYLPLKGIILKKMYPKSEMRYMGDADILIKCEQYDKIKEILPKIGFRFVKESNHEYIWQKNIVCIEFHKYLIPSYNEDYFAYYNDCWSLAKKENGKYSMLDEDFLIYLFTHLAKHYRDSGIGIRHFVDIWVYLKRKNELNREYIEAELGKLQLLEFYKNSLKMLEVWFGKAEEDDITKLMTQWVFSSGAFGTKETKEFSAALKKIKNREKNKKINFYILAIFPPAKDMKKRYSVLEKLPFLLPVFWGVRIVSAVFFRNQNIKNNKKRLEKLTEENLNEFETLLRAVGLNFNFKE